MLKLNSADGLEAYARWQAEGSKSLLCVHFVTGKLPSHWGYALSSGAREISSFLTHFELNDEVLASLEQILLAAE